MIDVVVCYPVSHFVVLCPGACSSCAAVSVSWWYSAHN